MANHSHPQQDNSAADSQARSSGGGQAVVDLCTATESGLVFWSRQRFDIGVELQIRIRRDVIPESWRPADSDEEAWVIISGFVVECPPMRKADGSSGFQVSLLLDRTHGEPARVCQQGPVLTERLPCVSTRFSGLKKQGLN